MSSDKAGWLVAALDAIAQFRATKEPLKNVVKRLAVQRKLGSRERAQMSEAVFAWSRAVHESDELVDDLKKGGINRPSHRQIDEAIITRWLQSEKKAELSFPAWFHTRLTKAYGEKAPQLLQSLSQRAGPALAFDPRHITKIKLCSALDAAQIAYQTWSQFEDAICIRASKFRLESLPAEIQKSVWVMDPASQLVAHLAQPRPGKKILDCCAGAGGKTQFLLSRGAKVTAMDVSERRLSQAKKRFRNEAVHFVVGDATNPPFEPESFEHILIDAPCSGTGTIRRAPDLLLRLSEDEIATYVALQREIIKNMVRILKKGGTLVYATCSILPEENQMQSQWAQSEFGLTLISERQLLPSLDDSDGFYVAILKKAAGTYS